MPNGAGPSRASLNYVVLSAVHPHSVVRPSLLSQINERRVLRAIQVHGPLSRAEVARRAGISPPTAGRAVDTLLRAGLLEENAAELTGGRPAKRLRLASETAQVLGLVIDAEYCSLVSAGLDGSLQEKREQRFPTPGTYEELIHAAAERAHKLMDRNGVNTLGLGISMPGLLDYRRQRGVLSPNVPITNDRSPCADLQSRLNLQCRMVQESHALCLAERHYGDAQNLDHFAVLDVGAGVGLGMMCGGRLLTGHSGLAGELGHIPVAWDGPLCGCGNRGCLETVASDAALARAVSQRLGRSVTLSELLEMAAESGGPAAEDFRQASRYLAQGLAAVLNLFNPSTVFIHGALFGSSPHLLAMLVEETRALALRPSFNDTQLLPARGTKRQGAIAAVIEYLTDSRVPTVSSGTGV